MFSSILTCVILLSHWNSSSKTKHHNFITRPLTHCSYLSLTIETSWLLFIYKAQIRIRHFPNVHTSQYQMLNNTWIAHIAFTSERSKQIQIWYRRFYPNTLKYWNSLQRPYRSVFISITMYSIGSIATDDLCLQITLSNCTHSPQLR